MTADSYCCEVSAEHNETMLGSAPEVTIWIVVEYRETWSSHVSNENKLDAATQSWISSSLEDCLAAGYKPRLQFIRRNRRDTGPLSLFVADGRHLKRQHFENYDELSAISVLDFNGDSVAEQQYFVCTNGQRDRCCGRFGWKAWERLVERVGDRAWQTTHLGGHRFAPNILTLPQGILYGRVFEESVEEFVDCVENGSVPRGFVRGRSSYPKMVQWCEFQVPSEVQVTELVSHDDQCVYFDSTAGQQKVRTPRSVQTPVLASCGDEAPTLAESFE